MRKSKQTDSDVLNQDVGVERVIDILEMAVTTEPQSDNAALPSEAKTDIATLPERLQDPLAVLERGRALLKSGLPLRGTAMNTEFDDQLRIAARNGKPIPDDIRHLMGDERRSGTSIATPAAQQGDPGASVPALYERQTQVKSATAVPPVGQREDEIEQLAALLVARSSAKDRVDLEKLADSEGITYSYGHYREYFDGLLECRSGAFHIYINLDTNKTSRSPRARFSFAHELGHYFLDWHRMALSRGVPPHGSKADFESANLAAEREADMFAANLLLPAVQVRDAARRCIDAEEIIRLAEIFCTSLSATAIRCARLDLSPLIVMRWTETKRAWCWSSKKYEQRTGNKAFRSADRIPQGSLTRQLLDRSCDRPAASQKGTTMSAWFPAVSSGSASDDILIEECISLGPHGALTILRPA